MELLSAPVNDDGPSKAFGMPGVATVTRRPSSKGGAHKNIATTMVDPRPPLRCPPPAPAPARKWGKTPGEPPIGHGLIHA